MSLHRGRNRWTLVSTLLYHYTPFFHDLVSPLLFPPKGAARGNNGYIATSISNEGEDLEHLDVKYVGLMQVAPANPPGGLATPTAVAPAAAAPAAVAPATAAPAAVTPAAAAPVAVAIGANHVILGRDQATKHHQSFIAAGNIGDPQAVLPTGIHGRNPDQVALLAQMNQKVARGIANLNSFLPNADEHSQACLKAALTSANQRYSAALANGRSTAAIEQLIDQLENQLEAIFNAI